MWIEEGARVTVSDGWVFTDRVELRGLEGGKVERSFYRSGFKRDYDAEGRSFLSNAIARMIRSGMFASDRVARFLKQGGPEAVLAELDRMQTDSSYVKRAYYSALLKQADPQPPVLGQILDRAAATSPRTTTRRPSSSRSSTRVRPRTIIASLSRRPLDASGATTNSAKC